MAVNDLPSNVSYGTVKGRFLLAYADGADSDVFPDGAPAKGTILFTPSPANIKDVTALVGSVVTPVTILPGTVSCDLDADGYLLGSDGTRGVRLVATDDPDTNPTNWTWQVDYRLTDQEGAAVRGIPTHDITLPSGTTVDLTEVAPVASADGTFYIRGEQGYSAYQVAVQDGFVGTDTEWLATLEGSSAYEVAVANGFTGNQSQWLATLEGTSAYGVAVENGFVGDEEAWLESLTGPQGPQGIPGDIANLTATAPIAFNPTTATISFNGLALDDVTNVTAPSPVAGDVLKWNGTAWVNGGLSEIYSLDNLSDVTISATPVAGDTIVYNGTNFVNQQAAEPLPAIMMMMGS